MVRISAVNDSMLKLFPLMISFWWRLSQCQHAGAQFPTLGPMLSIQVCCPYHGTSKAVDIIAQLTD